MISWFDYWVCGPNPTAWPFRWNSSPGRWYCSIFSFVYKRREDLRLLLIPPKRQRIKEYLLFLISLFWQPPISLLFPTPPFFSLSIVKQCQYTKKKKKHKRNKRWTREKKKHKWNKVKQSETEGFKPFLGKFGRGCSAKALALPPPQISSNLQQFLQDHLENQQRGKAGRWCRSGSAI